MIFFQDIQTDSYKLLYDTCLLLGYVEERNHDRSGTVLVNFLQDPEFSKKPQIPKYYQILKTIKNHGSETDKY